jgi:alcohol dehydrogenase (NADP+)
VGDAAGVGCYVDSCRICPPCKKGFEQFCDKHTAFTYNSTEMDLRTPTYGGYSAQIVVDENYALRISPKLPIERTAPLLCAGITTYSPLRHWEVGKGQRVGVVGLGGLGHMAVKLAASMGAEVTVLSTSQSKEPDARRLGAHEFVLSSNPATLKTLAGRFDFLIDTVSAEHDVDSMLALLRMDGAMVLVGVPSKPMTLDAFSVISRRKTLAGSMIGGIAETQEMLDYCAKKNIAADVEIIPIAQVNKAYERMVKGDVRYRFVIDLKTL